MNASQQAPLFDDRPKKNEGPVKCLGMTFESDEARRAYFTERLHEKLQDPEFRKIEGFPIGEEEDILRMSDPPYFTLCPNPFLGELVAQNSRTHEKDFIVHNPYTGSLVNEERHPVYSYQPYHTKVPPDIIRRLIEHYTQPNDLILDGFSGAGMTGVAARESGRKAILVDLCPIAAFTSQVNCTSNDWQEALEQMHEIIQESRKRYSNFYLTHEKGVRVEVNYFVWSDVFTCPECVFEFPFFPYGVIHHGDKVETRKSFPCPNCGAELNVRRVERVLVHEGKKRALVWVNAGSGKSRINREPNVYDMELWQKIEAQPMEDWFPVDSIAPDGYSAKLAQLGDKAISNVSKFLSKRNLIIFADLWNRVGQIEDTGIRNVCLSTLTSIFTVISERQGYFGGGGGMSGNLYMPIVRMEKNIYDVLERKLRKLEDAEKAKLGLSSSVFLSTQSSTQLQAIREKSIDYIYTDPPFGANIIYSEMNLILEAWLKVKTNNRHEAVIDQTRDQGFDQYANLMRRCFREYYRVLKPGHWITVEFHNTQASVWNLIQTCIWESGFVITNIGFLDKGSTTILADIRPGAAKYDLIISAYRPTEELENSFSLSQGSEKNVWDFVRNYLTHIPVCEKNAGGKIAIIPGRTPQMIFDRVVAYHIQQGQSLPVSMPEFLEGLGQRFSERSGMYFLPEQATEWDGEFLRSSGVEQLPLFVIDEQSAIQWIRQELEKEPQTYQQLHPKFNAISSNWARHEKMLDLADLLRENFMDYPGSGPVPETLWKLIDHKPAQSSMEHPSPELQYALKGLWYVPDSNHEKDMIKMREKALLKEFDTYCAHSGRALKVFRMEALRLGFKLAWERKEYATIIKVAGIIPEEFLQEDPKLLLWYDQAITRSN